MSRSKELEVWIDEWSEKLDSVEEGFEKEMFDFKLFEKFTLFMLKVCMFPQKHFFIADDEVAEEE